MTTLMMGLSIAGPGLQLANRSFVKQANATSVAKFSSADVVTSTAYGPYSNTDWLVTYGGNNASVGTNSSKRANCVLAGDNAKYAVSPVTSTDTATAFASKSTLSNVNQLNLKYNGGSNPTRANVYLLYSADNTTFSQITLTTGTQGAAIGTDMTFNFDALSGYFAVVYKDTGTSGNFRIDNVDGEFQYLEPSTEKTITISSEHAYTKVGTPLNFSAEFANYDTNPTELIYVSSDTEVATITDEGVLTPLKYGKTTITATDGDIDSNSIEITVYPDNTNAMSVSEVLTFMEAIYPNTSADPMPYDYSTVGIVASIGTAYSSQYDNISITIQDETEVGKQLYCFRLAGGETLKVGDKIKVTGAIGTHSSAWQYTAGATYELLEASKVKTITLESATGKNYTTMGTNLQINAEFENYDTDPEITFGSSDETVATITDEGVLTPVGIGTTLIQATDGEVLSDDLEITVYPDNTVDFSVTELLNFLPEVLDVSESGQLPYAYSTYGVVKSIKTAYNSTNDNISIVLADVDDDTKTITCYKLSGGEDLQVGDNIKVTGTINTYKNEYQYMEGSTYVPFEKVLTPKEKLAKKNTVSSLYYQYTKTTSGEAVTDTLNYSATGISGAGYSEWSGKTGTSGAVYAGQSGGTYSSIQLRTTNSNSGIVTTTSGGKATKVTVTWNTNTTEGRVLDIYGSNTAYTDATDLYDDEKQGTLLGSITYGTSTGLDITGDYTYIGVRSHSGALYLDELTIQWGGAASYTIDEAAIRYGAVIEKSLYAELGNVTSYGVILGSEGGLAAAGKDSLKAFYEANSTKANFEEIKNLYKIKDFNYTDEQATANEEQISALGIDEPCYVYNVFVDLKDHLTTDIYALAYVEIDGERVFLEEVNYSVASLAKAYIDKGVKDASAYDGSLNYLASLVA